MKKFLTIALVLTLAIYFVCYFPRKSPLDKAKAGIGDFENEISGNEVILKEYNGLKKCLYVLPQYEINGRTYESNLSELSIDNSRTRFVIFGNGIKSINDSTFNGSDVEKVYFPKTMECVYDNTLNYLHSEDGRKIQIYYEGTREEWNKIFTKYERQTVKEAWNSSDDWEEKGAAVGKSVADKLNGLMGNYNDAGFEYHYSVSEEDLENLMK